jgi:hypothetical protein
MKLLTGATFVETNLGCVFLLKVKRLTIVPNPKKNK